MINKGQVMTQYYRIMNKNGGYTWVQTCATVVCNSKNAEEQNVICVNYVIRYVISNHFQLCSVVKIISCLIDLDVRTPRAPDIVIPISDRDQWWLVGLSCGMAGSGIIIRLMRKLWIGVLFSSRPLNGLSLAYMTGWNFIIYICIRIDNECEIAKSDVARPKFLNSFCLEEANCEKLMLISNSRCSC